MKKNRILKIASIVIVIAMFAFTSCERQKKNTPKPVVKNLELGIKTATRLTSAPIFISKPISKPKV